VENQRWKLGAGSVIPKIERSSQSRLTQRQIIRRLRMIFLFWTYLVYQRGGIDDRVLSGEVGGNVIETDANKSVGHDGVVGYGLGGASEVDPDPFTNFVTGNRGRGAINHYACAKS
jgi:hypothetical protein